MAVGIDIKLRSVHTMSHLAGETTRSMRRLSSGLRVASAADDAAGLIQATGMDSRRIGMRVANRSAEEAMGVLNAVDGHLQSAVSELQRVRAMVLQLSGSAAAGTAAGNAVEAEAAAIISHLDASLRGARYGTFALFQPAATTIPGTPGVPGTPGTAAVAGTLTGAGTTGVVPNGGFDNTSGANSTFNLVIDGVTHTLTLASVNMNNRNAVRNAVSDAIEASATLRLTGSTDATGTVELGVAFDASNRLVFTAASGSSVSLAGTPGSASGAGALNLVGGTVVAGVAGTAGTPGSPGTPATTGAQPASHELRFQLGPDGDHALSIDLPALDAARLGLDNLDLADPNALQQIDDALATLLETAGRAGAFHSRLTIAASFSLEQAALIDQASDRIVGADMAIEQTELIRNRVRLEAATAMAGQARSLDLQQVSRLLTA